jgi:hypothetical protein
MRKRRAAPARSTIASPVPAAITLHKHLSDMTPDESTLYLGQLMDRLSQKQQRERDYLDRRAKRGTRTPTDELYEQDQVLEDELLALLSDLLMEKQTGVLPDAAQAGEADEL